MHLAPFHTSCPRDKSSWSVCSRAPKRKELSKCVMTTHHESTSYNVTVHESLSVLNVYRAHLHISTHRNCTRQSPDTRIQKSEKIGRPSAYKAIPCVRERIRHSGRPCVPSGHANHHNGITTAPMRSTTQDPPNKQPGTCRAETSGTSHEKAALRSRLQRQRAATVTAYRLKLLLPAPRQSSTCREQGIWSCQSVVQGGDQKSLTGAPFELGEKICHTNSGTADTMGAIFSRADAAFTGSEHPKLVK